MLKPTPFHSRTGPLCQGQSWANWAGFLAATTYEPDHLHEYNAVRTGSGLFDVSPLFKYDIRGRDALAMVNRVVVRDVCVECVVTDVDQYVPAILVGRLVTDVPLG